MAASLLKSSGTTARLSVDLQALKTNYKTLARLAGSSVCTGVVKADGYGLGAGPVAKALWDAGCRTYCVALLSEAAVLRDILPDAEIFILSGLMKGAASDYARLEARPVLASTEEIDEWSQLCRSTDQQLPAAVHVDTGINRLGIDYVEAVQLFQNPRSFRDFKLCMVMSHFACADEPEHPLNGEQIAKFKTLRSLAPGVAFSLANSAGILLGPEAHFDMVRPGIALYGCNPVENSATKLERVVTLEAAVLQVRHVAAGQSVGYGATFVCQRPSKIAIIGLGYADGYPRALSAATEQTTTYVDFSGHRAPVAGRISMDMTGVDVTDIPGHAVARGMRAEIIGENISLDGVAHAGKTFSYELLTRLGNRFERVYLNF